MDSSSILNQINGLQQQYKNIGATNPQDIYSQFAQKVQGFKPQYDQLAQANTEALSYPAQAMQQYAQQGNNSGPDAFARLSAILQGQGQRQGTAQALNGAIQTEQGGLQNIANGVNASIQSQGSNLNNQIGQLSSIYGTTLQSENAQKQLELQRQQMAQAAAQAQAVPFPTSNPSNGQTYDSQTALNNASGLVNGQATRVIQAVQDMMKKGQWNPNSQQGQQALSVLRQLGFDPQKINFNAGM